MSARIPRLYDVHALKLAVAGTADAGRKRSCRGPRQIVARHAVLPSLVGSTQQVLYVFVAAGLRFFCRTGPFRRLNVDLQLTRCMTPGTVRKNYLASSMSCAESAHS
jgi:hypothetical protein